MTHVYLSPILQANPGSPHGYDVVDHSRVSADLGGEDAFRAMAERFHRHRLGIVVDIVPNHMARPTPESLNKQLWSVLFQGRASPFAHWFDIDWDAEDGKLLMPILAGPLEKCLDDLIIDTAPKNPGPRRAPRPGAALLRSRAAAAGRRRATCRWASCSPSSTTGWPTGTRRPPSSTGAGSSTSTR